MVVRKGDKTKTVEELLAAVATAGTVVNMDITHGTAQITTAS